MVKASKEDFEIGARSTAHHNGALETSADRAIRSVSGKLSSDLSVEYTTNDLIRQACDETNLACIFHGTIFTRKDSARLTKPRMECIDVMMYIPWYLLFAKPAIGDQLRQTESQYGKLVCERGPQAIGIYPIVVASLEGIKYLLHFRRVFDIMLRRLE